MTVQVYRVQISDNHPPARPGQFIFPSDDVEMICGFVSQVNGNDVEICLFDPVPDAELASTFSASGLTFQKVADTANWEELLTRALELNPDIKSQWIELLPSS